MTVLKAAILAVALFFTTAFPAFADSPTKAAMSQLISTETRGTKVSTSDITRIVNAVFASAKKYGLDPFLIVSLIDTESKYRSWAKNKSGASGLTQVIPYWHREKIKGRNIMNIETNIEIGTQVLAECLERNKRLINKALICYSGGASNYAAKLKASHAKMKLADITYRFENGLPLTVVSRFDKPYQFSIVDESVQTANWQKLQDRELLASAETY